MESIGIILLIGIVASVFWISGKLIRAGWVFVTLPIRLICAVAGVLFLVLIVPLGLLAGIIGLLLPLGLAAILLPVLIIGLGLSVLTHR